MAVHSPDVVRSHWRHRSGPISSVLAEFLSFVFWVIVVLLSVKWCLVCISMKAEDSEHLLCVFATYLFSLETYMSILVLCPFYVGLSFTFELRLWFALPTCRYQSCTYIIRMAPVHLPLGGSFLHSTLGLVSYKAHRCQT